MPVSDILQLVSDFGIFFSFQKIGCRLKIFSNIAPQSTDRIAQVIGKEQQCIDTLVEIIDLIKNTPVKGPVRNYDPHNYDEIYADEYGGYGGGPGNAYGRGGAGGAAPSGGGNRSGGGGGFGGGGGRFDDRGPRGGGGAGNGPRGGGGPMRGGRDFVDPWGELDKLF